jgi:hypothetical protein
VSIRAENLYGFDWVRGHRSAHSFSSLPVTITFFS